MRSVLLVAALIASVNAFSLSESRTVDRRAFLGTAALIVATPAVAIDDLAMPTAEETEKSDEEKMKERLRLKAELQKKASQPKNFAESLKGEKTKQQELQGMSKEERRNRLCEELGRGC